MHQWPVGQVVKTAASHAVNIGSNPVRVTTSFDKKKFLTERDSGVIIHFAIRAVDRFDIKDGESHPN